MSRTTLRDVNQFLGMNVLHPAGVEVCCRGLKGILDGARSITEMVGSISCGRKSSRAGGAREGCLVVTGVKPTTFFFQPTGASKGKTGRGEIFT